MTQTTSSGVDAGAGATDQAGHAHQNQFLLLVLGAIGVVYGDIGTSPLYAFRESLHVSTSQGAPVDPATVYGLLSLIVWTLIVLVTGKYVGVVLRADNKGEGGTLSLMALAQSSFTKRPLIVLVMGVLGAALFFGDAMITPAISVLSAIEGVQVVAPAFADWVLPITIVVIVALFAVQRFGTGSVAAVFGPITTVWFLSLAGFGVAQIVQHPEVLLSFNPLYGVQFIATHPAIAAATFGAVFLAVTGAEALYADLGHFGRRPIVVAWFALVFPCLLLNYFGQGAFVLGHAEEVENPFYQMLPGWAQLPMVLLATLATVIASQAVITGAFSLTRQAVQLNFLPRMRILHTSETQLGQIYMPVVNGLLMVAVVLLVVGFGSSSALGAAYGIAVTGEMLATLGLIGIVMYRKWKWRPWMLMLFIVPVGVIELVFFSSNMAKFLQGGWVPAVVAILIAAVISIWIVGRNRLAARTRRDEVPLEFLVDNLAKKKPKTVPGTAVFLTSDIEGAPTALLHSLKHYKVLHEQNVILTVVTSESPRVPDEEKIRIDAYNDLFYRVLVTFGYMETPNIPKALALARKLGWKFDIMSTSFFLSRRSLKPSPKGGMPLWFDRVFIALARNATDATEYFHIPTGRVVEIGTQVII
jgi:KUP system potassium uptake protein